MEKVNVYDINEKKLYLHKDVILKRAEKIYKLKLNFIEKILSNEIEISHDKFTKKMGSFGGQISGLTRNLKEILVLSIVKMLIDNNQNFKELSIREVRIFLKLVLNVAASQKNLKSFNFEHLKNEKEEAKDYWVKNVHNPSITAYLPEKGKANGVGVLIFPGGGHRLLVIDAEGTEAAEFFNKHGIAAFVLKYRLVPTGEDGVKEITDEGASNPQKIVERVAPVLPLSIADGLTAIAHVRTNASQWDLDPQKIGFMGFSAGGAVTMGIVYNYTFSNRPNFIVPVYPWTTVMPIQKAPENAPPMLVICASDDPLGLAAGSIELYASWLKAGKIAGLHMYSKGGHGFGMKQQNLPSDTWIERFYDSVGQSRTTPLRAL